MFANEATDKGLISKCKNGSCSSTLKKKTNNPIHKRAEDISLKKIYRQPTNT